MDINNKLGTKWFTFYTKIRPWLACLATISVIIEFFMYFEVYVQNWWLWIYLGLAIAQSIVCVIVAIKSFGDYADFVCLVKRALLIETFSLAYEMCIRQYIMGGYDIIHALVGFVLGTVILYFVWYKTNAVYFENRINVKTDNVSEDTSKVVLNKVAECIFCGYSGKDFQNACPNCGKYAKRYVCLDEEIDYETDKVCFCRNCGEELLDDSKFCRKCGTEVVNE